VVAIWWRSARTQGSRRWAVKGRSSVVAGAPAASHSPRSGAPEAGPAQPLSAPTDHDGGLCVAQSATGPPSRRVLCDCLLIFRFAWPPATRGSGCRD